METGSRNRDATKRTIGQSSGMHVTNRGRLGRHIIQVCMGALAVLAFAQSASAGIGGACCTDALGTDGCIEVDPGTNLPIDQETCEQLGGTYAGDGVSCQSQTVCPVGACCQAGDTCMDFFAGLYITEDGCTDNGGIYAGDGTTCNTDPCAELNQDGACCIPPGVLGFPTCLDEYPITDDPLTVFLCDAVGGTYAGPGTTCLEQTICPVGACCTPDGCIDDASEGNYLTESTCGVFGGTFVGGGTTCDASDDDMDSVPNTCDLCEGDDIFGDSDSDGTCDDLDACPLDPFKNGPGICGCGVPDTDGDNDSVVGCLDCNDSNSDVFPGNTETLCDNTDNDCDPMTEDNPGGICDIAAPTLVAVGPRYLEVTPTGGDVTVALNITSSDAACLSRYVDFDNDAELASLGIGTLVDTPVFRTPSEWGTLLIRGTEIVPGQAYTVQAETDGQVAVAPSASQSTFAHGDVDDNTFANFSDIQAVVLGFQEVWTGSLGAVDLAPCLPNAIVNFEDIQVAVFAFQGQAFDALCDLPCNGGVAYAGYENDQLPSSRLELRSNHEVGGDGVEVEVWASRASALHTYQVSLDAVDGDGNSLRLIDSWIDEHHDDFIFTGDATITASHEESGTIGASTMNVGVDVSEEHPVYLATFLLESPTGRSSNVHVEVKSESSLMKDDRGWSMNMISNPTTVSVRPNAVRKNLDDVR
ncbi:MAG: putative metal-binding motif-containing protein [Phycisphaerae bacterium]